MKQIQKQKAILSQQKYLMMTQAMKQSIEILKLPIMELKVLLEKEIEENPLLELNYSKKTTDINFNLIPHIPSLYEHLIKQSQDSFDKKEDQIIAENIIGNLDESGYFNHSIKALSKKLECSIEKIEWVLNIIKSFEPNGIASKNLQECILSQIKNKNSIFYLIVKDHFDDLLNNRFLNIRKKLKISTNQIKSFFEEGIKNINLSPAKCFDTHFFANICPDAYIKKINEQWMVIINEEELPILNLNPEYRSLSSTLKNEDEKRFVHEYKLSFDWLQKALNIRNKTLLLIISLICKKQIAFFEGKNSVKFMSIEEISTELKLHPSTISRAISNKYISCPIGIVPIKDFFSSSLQSKENKKTSSKAAIDTLKSLIANEDKFYPFSDIELSQKLENEGYICKRRTITKYRKKLLIGSSKQRKRL